MVFKAVNPLFWCIFSKTSISPRRNYKFWGLWEFSTYSTWHVLIPVLVTATLRVLPRTFADLDCLRYNASTTWTHGKFQRTYNSVAWRMSGKFQITYREACPSSASSHERYYMPHPTPPVHTCTYRQPQRSMSFLRKFTWTLLHAPPHATPPVHTCTYRQPQTSMSFLRKFTWALLHASPHPTPPHSPDVYKTPRPSKGLGPYIYIYIYYMYMLTCQYTSSTAQGGGGSFKNRKPIGEVGCCESGMAERSHWWTERCLRFPLFRFLYLTIYLPTYLSTMYLSIYLSIYPYLSIYLSPSLSLSHSHSLSLSLSLSLAFICLSV